MMESSFEIVPTFKVNGKQSDIFILLRVLNVSVHPIDELQNVFDCLIDKIICGLPRSGMFTHVALKNSAALLHAVA